MSNLDEMQRRAIGIRHKYAERNRRDGHDVWGGKEYAMGFVGDVGDLMKLVMAKENLRAIDEVDALLAHELSDCLWCVLVLADVYHVDLTAEFTRTMGELERHLAQEP